MDIFSLCETLDTLSNMCYTIFETVYMAVAFISCLYNMYTTYAPRAVCAPSLDRRTIMGVAHGAFRGQLGLSMSISMDRVIYADP